MTIVGLPLVSPAYTPHPSNTCELIVDQKGISANLMKIGSKRRRTGAQIREDGLAAQLKEQMQEQLQQ